MFTLTRRRRASSACSTCPVTTWPTLVEKSGKSASHIYARLSLLQLIPEVAEAFTQERITASHANLIARLPQEFKPKPSSSAGARTGRTRKPISYPPSSLSSWIQNNLYLCPCRCAFRPRRRDPQPRRRSLHHLPPPQRIQHSTFFDVLSDECLDWKLLSCEDFRAHRPRDRRPP